MRIFVAFDDTDVSGAERGTGKLARWFERELSEGFRLWGVARQQLPLDPSIPYTSHNSAACAVVEAPDRSALPLLVDRAVTHLEKHFLEGSALGLCVTAEDDPGMTRLISFGRRAATRIVSQAEAREAAAGCHLSGHGGTCDGIIGAAAAVGLTAAGWSGRFIEYGGLRSLPSRARVAELEHRGMLVVAVDRDAAVPAPMTKSRPEAGSDPGSGAAGLSYPWPGRGSSCGPRSVARTAETQGQTVDASVRREEEETCRERSSIENEPRPERGRRSPVCMLVGVAGTDLKVFAKHVRKSELEQIAETIGADLVLLQRRKQEAGEEDEDVEVPE